MAVVLVFKIEDLGLQVSETTDDVYSFVVAAVIMLIADLFFFFSVFKSMILVTQIY